MRFLPAGPSALLVEVHGTSEVLSLLAEIERHRQHGWLECPVDVVAGATTVLLDGVANPARIAEELRRWSVPPVSAKAADAIEIPCRYDGPDLGEVARQWGVSEAAVIAIHSSLVHRVAFCGFAPGFAYIAGLGEARRTARRAAPRPAVPAGSVALAGEHTGIYPRVSPGGWQLIGTTETVLWDLDREPPALLVPGTTVRFSPR